MTDLNIDNSQINMSNSQTQTQGPQSVSALSSKTSDTSESVQGKDQAGKKGSKVNPADIPNILLASWIMQLHQAGSASIQPFDTAKGQQDIKISINDALKAFQIGEQEITLKVLKAWSDSVQKDAKLSAEASRKQQKEVQERKDETLKKEAAAAQGAAGVQGASVHEKFMKSSTTTEKIHAEGSNQTVGYLENRASFDQALGKYMGDDTSGLIGSVSQSNQSIVPNDTAYAAAAVGMVVESLNSAAPAIAASHVKNDAVLQTFQQVTPSYAVDLSLVVQANNAMAINLGMIQTLKQAAVNGGDPEENTKQFGENYAAQVVSFVNGDQFPNFVLSIIAHRADQGQPMNADQRDALVLKAKAVWLASALALLYKLGSSYKGEGGGITGEEFMALVKGDLEATPGQKLLIGQLKQVLDELPEGDQLLSHFASSLGSDTKIKTLADPKSLFASLYVEDQGAIPLPA